MKDHIFEELIQVEQVRRLPACPSNLEANVLRRVRLVSSDSEEIGRLDWIFGLLLQKSLAFGVLALTLFLSVTSTMIVTFSTTHAIETQNLAMSALDFGVFKKTSFFKLEN